MRSALAAAVVLSCAALIAGCKEEPKPATGTPGSPATAAAAATQNAGAAVSNTVDAIGAKASEVKDKAADKASDLKDKAVDLKDQAATKAADLTGKAADKSSEMKADATGKAAAADQATGDTAGVQAKAKSLFEQATKALSEGKLDVADKAVAELDKIKPSLSPEWQTRVDQLKTGVETAKKAGGIKIPGL